MKAVLPRRFVYFVTMISMLGGASAQDEGYPPGTLTPPVDLGLQPVAVQVPQQLADQVPVGLSLNVPEGFTVGLFAAGLRGPRFMAFDDNEVLHVANMNADQIVALPDRDRDAALHRHGPRCLEPAAAQRVRQADR